MVLVINSYLKTTLNWHQQALMNEWVALNSTPFHIFSSHFLLSLTYFSFLQYTIKLLELIQNHSKLRGPVSAQCRLKESFGDHCNIQKKKMALLLRDND